jgi:hypothetical protein
MTLKLVVQLWLALGLAATLVSCAVIAVRRLIERRGL